MLDEYTSAFARYLRTGTVGTLSDFCAEDAELSRLRVYRNGFLRACIEALRASYPSVERVAGEERFPALARPFVEAHPPRDASLVLYGEDFSQFIERTRDVHGLDCLASFAALDRAWTEVYFSADGGIEAAPPGSPSGEGAAPPDASGPISEGVQPASDSGISGATAPAAGVPDHGEVLMNLRGRLSPWVRLVSLDYAVLDVWRRLRQGEPGRCAELRRTPQRILIWRSGAEMLYRDLTPPEHAFIAGVAAGLPCGDAAGAALDLDAKLDLVAIFASLLHHRMLSFEP